MPEKREDPRAARSRAALLEAAISLLLEQPGASLSEVAARAGVGRATLYRHFDTREKLVEALALKCLEDTDNAMAPIHDAGLKGRAAIEAMFQRIMPLAHRFHFLLSLWLSPEEYSEVAPIYNDQLAILGRWIEEARQQREINRRYNTTWLVSVIDGLVYAGWWVVQAGEATAEEAAADAASTLFNGVG